MKNIVFAICLLFVFGLHGQQINKFEGGIFLLKEGKVYTHDNGLQQLDVLIVDGFIKEVHSKISHPGAKQINCKDLFIYPGMIDSGTKLGLAEIGAVSLTQDHNEIGNFTPHMDALTAVNPSSVNIPVTRVNGVTTSLAVPSGGRFPGTAALIDLHGYTPDQMYAGFKGVVFNYPSTGRRGSWDRRSDEEIKKAEQKAQKELNTFWKNVEKRSEMMKKADASGKTLEYNPQLDAMVPIVNKEGTLLIEVNRKKDILSALRWLKDKDINVLLTGVSEGYRVADSISAAEIPVITGPVLSNPGRTSDKYDVAYSNAATLQKAGVKVALRTNETENVRNLPFNAGFAATYGMGIIEAMKAITINPAEIFGIDDLYGSIEAG